MQYVNKLCIYIRNIKEQCAKIKIQKQKVTQKKRISVAVSILCEICYNIVFS